MTIVCPNQRTEIQKEVHKPKWFRQQKEGYFLRYVCPYVVDDFARCLSPDLGQFWWTSYVLFGGQLEGVFGALSPAFEKDIKSGWSGRIVEAQG